MATPDAVAEGLTKTIEYFDDLLKTDPDFVREVNRSRLLNWRNRERLSLSVPIDATYYFLFIGYRFPSLLDLRHT